MDVEKKLSLLTNDCANTPSSIDAPLVTIGITNFNGNDFLDQCIISILDQSFKSIEIIIVDDHSNDSSVEKIKGYEKQYKNIRAVYHSSNSGSPDSGRQEIINDANGEFLMLVDSDDYFANSMTVEKLLEELERFPELDYVYCNMLIVDKNGTQTDMWKYMQYSDEDLIHDTFQRGGSGVIPMKGMFRKNFFIKNSLSWQSNGTAGDTLSALVYTQQGWKYKHLNLDLLCYRQYGESFTFNLDKRIKSIVNILDYIIENFNEETYLPRIPWNQLDNLTRHNIKMYLLGQFHYEVLKVYNSYWSLLNLDGCNKNQEMTESLLPLKDRIGFYFSQCCKPNLLSSNMKKVLKEVDEMFS